jgi:hypothetical protein
MDRTSDPRRHAPATLRNRAPILAVLQRVLPASGLLLEVASGSGEHAAWMAPQLPPGLAWQPSEADALALPGIDAHARDAGATTVRPAIRLDAAAADWPIAAADAVFCCNLAHIAPWAATEGLLAGAARLLPPGGPLVLYGPFRRHGRHTAASNAAFEASLQARDPAWRIRCVDNELVPAAARHGLVLDEVVELPANNLVLVWRRESLSAA